MNPKICVSIPVTGLKAASQLVAEACEKGADYIEYRLDYLDESIDLKDLAKTATIPKIFTLRSRDEGGLCNLDDEEAYTTLKLAAKSGFEYIDLELTSKDVKKKIKSIKGEGTKTIVSKHFLNETPEAPLLEKTLSDEVKVGADICKIVSTARKYEDNLKILNFLSSVQSDAKPICFAMGPMGRPSRILAPYLGSPFMYASLRTDKKAAPGQMTIEDLRNIYRVMSGDT